jgi:hypothetical protein
VPADISDTADGAAREVATSDPRGTVFRVVEYAPVAPRQQNDRA